MITADVCPICGTEWFMGHRACDHIDGNPVPRWKYLRSLAEREKVSQEACRGVQLDLLPPELPSHLPPP